MADKTIALDFDGVLHRYRGWDGGRLEEPLPGALEAVKKLARMGYKLVVYSARPAGEIRAWLKRHGFPALEVTAGKPTAQAYVDDRAVRFEGRWDEPMMRLITESKPYWERRARPAVTLASLGGANGAGEEDESK